MEFQSLSVFSPKKVRDALRQGRLEMALGPFSMRLQGADKSLTSFLLDVYRDAPVRLCLEDVTDVTIHVRAPNFLRKYIRRQVIPDPGFIVPAVPLPPTLAPLALEMGLNLSVALKCCRFTTFHAAVVGSDKGCILISANSGGGKSTLASALMEEGYRLFSDEFGLLDHGNTVLHPYPRPVSLKGQSIQIVKNFAGVEWMSKTLSGTPKGDIAYRRARASDIASANQPLPAKLILFPSFQEGATSTTKEISKPEALMKLIPSSTNYHLLGEPAFTSLVRMVSGARAYEITYGSTAESLRITTELAEGTDL